MADNDVTYVGPVGGYFESFILNGQEFPVQNIVIDLTSDDPKSLVFIKDDDLEEKTNVNPTENGAEKQENELTDEEKDSASTVFGIENRDFDSGKIRKSSRVKNQKCPKSKNQSCPKTSKSSNQKCLKSSQSVNRKNIKRYPKIKLNHGKPSQISNRRTCGAKPAFERSTIKTSAADNAVCRRKSLSGTARTRGVLSGTARTRGILAGTARTGALIDTPENQNSDSQPETVCRGTNGTAQPAKIQSTDSQQKIVCKKCHMLFRSLSNIEVHMLRFHRQNNWQMFTQISNCSANGAEMEFEATKKMSINKEHLNGIIKSGKTQKVDPNLRIGAETVETTKKTCPSRKRGRPRKTQKVDPNIRIGAETFETTKKTYSPKIGDSTAKCKTCQELKNKGKCLMIHMRKLHPEQLPFSCSICGMKFYTDFLLRKHRKEIHEENRVFKCNTCGKTCTSNSNLKRHKMIHTGLKPFKCGSCKKRFLFKVYLNSHEKIRHFGKKK